MSLRHAREINRNREWAVKRETESRLVAMARVLKPSAVKSSEKPLKPVGDTLTNQLLNADGNMNDWRS